MRLKTGLSGALLVFEDDWVRLTVPADAAALSADPARLGAPAFARRIVSTVKHF